MEEEFADHTVPFCEQVIHFLPVAEYIVTIVVCLQTASESRRLEEDYSRDELSLGSLEQIYFGFWVVVPVVLSFLSVMLDLATMSLLCNRRRESKRTLVYRVINEILMVSTCTTTIYLASLYHSSESIGFSVAYALSSMIYGFATLLNLVLVFQHIKKYRGDRL